MFGVLNSLTKAAVGIVTTPITLVADAATLGGALTDKKQPYTATQLEAALKNLQKATR